MLMYFILFIYLEINEYRQTYDSCWVGWTHVISDFFFYMHVESSYLIIIIIIFYTHVFKLAACFGFT